MLLLLLRKYTSYPLGPLRIVAAGAKTGALGAWDLISSRTRRPATFAAIGRHALPLRHAFSSRACQGLRQVLGC